MAGFVLPVARLDGEAEAEAQQAAASVELEQELAKLEEQRRQVERREAGHAVGY